MRESISIAIAVAIGLVSVGCGPAKVKAPDPNPVGQWQWSNEALGTWRLDIGADGAFRREIKSPLDPKLTKVSGRWTLKVTERDPSWLESHGIFQKRDPLDDLMRTAGHDPDKSTTEWSAPGTLTFTYSSPEGARLVPGATVLERKPSADFSLKQPLETPIQENQSVRTRTEKSIGKTYLELGGKTFQKIEGSGVMATPANEGGIAAREPVEKKGSKAAALVAEKQKYLTIQPFAGITLELPENWRGIDPGATEQLMTSMAAIVGKPRGLRTNATWVFLPPGDAPDVNITLSIQPALLSPQEMAALPETDISRFAKGFLNTGSRSLEAKGYHLKPGVKTERVTFGKRQAISFQAEAATAADGILFIQGLLVPTENAAVVIGFSWVDAAGDPWKPIMERARSSFRIADTIAAPQP